MISLKELEALESRDDLEEKAEDLASSVLSTTRDDIQDVYGEDGDTERPEHVYGLAGIKSSWLETLVIGKWIAEAKNEILAELRTHQQAHHSPANDEEE